MSRANESLSEVALKKLMHSKQVVSQCHFGKCCDKQIITDYKVKTPGQ